MIYNILLVAFKDARARNVFQLHYMHYEIEATSVHKVSCFSASRSNKLFLHELKVVLFEPKKPKLSL